MNIKPYTKAMQTRKREPIRVTKKRLDAKHSRYIRLRDGLRCRICGRQFEMYENNKGEMVIPKDYQCAHIIDRIKGQVRYHPKNTAGLCSGCHIKFDGKWKIFDDGKAEFRRMAYKRMRVTESDLDLLRHAAGQSGKPDYSGIELWLDRELAKFEITKEMADL